MAIIEQNTTSPHAHAKGVEKRAFVPCWWGVLQQPWRPRWRLLSKPPLELPRDPDSTSGSKENPNTKTRHAPQRSERHSLQQPKRGSIPSVRARTDQDGAEYTRDGTPATRKSKTVPLQHG